MAQKEINTVGDQKIEVAPEERTPPVEALLRIIQQQQQEIEKLREEINRLKGLPDPPKRPPQPSSLNDPLAAISTHLLRSDPNLSQTPRCQSRVM